MASNRMAGKTVVVVGASSGIGRAASELFASKGARLVLTARGEAGLEATAAACRAHGAAVITVVGDISVADVAQAVLTRAVEAFGAVDVWVNNAGVGAVGLFDETPMAANEQIVATNLIGGMHGAHAAIGYFKARGEGVLINTLSLGSFVPAPYAGAYSATKFALRALSQSLRGELAASPHIHVCDVLPTFVDTPGLAHGANFTGRAIKPPPPLVGPKAVARAIVAAAERPRPHTVVGRGMTLVARAAYAVSPELTMRMMRLGFASYFAAARRVAPTEGNLFSPSVGGAVEGGYRSKSGRLIATSAAVLAVVGLGALWLGSSVKGRA